MKQTWLIKILAAALVLLTALALIACSGDWDSTDDGDNSSIGAPDGMKPGYQEDGVLTMYIPRNWTVQEDGIGQLTAHSKDGKCRVRLVIETTVDTYDSAEAYARWLFDNAKAAADADGASLKILQELTQTKLGGKEAYTYTHQQILGDEDFAVCLTNREIFRYQNGKAYGITFSPIGDACTENFSFAPYEKDIQAICDAFMWEDSEPTNPVKPTTTPLPGTTTDNGPSTNAPETNLPETDPPATQRPSTTTKPVTNRPTTTNPYPSTEPEIEIDPPVSVGPDTSAPEIEIDPPVSGVYAALVMEGHFVLWAPYNWSTVQDEDGSWKVVAPDGLSALQINAVDLGGESYTSREAAELIYPELEATYGDMLLGKSDIQEITLDGQKAALQMFRIQYSPSVLLQQAVIYCVKDGYLYTATLVAWEDSSYTGFGDDLVRFIDFFDFV